MAARTVDASCSNNIEQFIFLAIAAFELAALKLKEVFSSWIMHSIKFTHIFSLVSS